MLNYLSTVLFYFIDAILNKNIKRPLLFFIYWGYKCMIKVSNNYSKKQFIFLLISTDIHESLHGFSSFYKELFKEAPVSFTILSLIFILLLYVIYTVPDATILERHLYFAVTFYICILWFSGLLFFYWYSIAINDVLFLYNKFAVLSSSLELCREHCTFSEKLSILESDNIGYTDSVIDTILLLYVIVIFLFCILLHPIFMWWTEYSYNKWPIDDRAGHVYRSIKLYMWYVFFFCIISFIFLNKYFPQSVHYWFEFFFILVPFLCFFCVLFIFFFVNTIVFISYLYHLYVVPEKPQREIVAVGSDHYYVDPEEVTYRIIDIDLVVFNVTCVAWTAILYLFCCVGTSFWLDSIDIVSVKYLSFLQSTSWPFFIETLVSFFAHYGGQLSIISIVNIFLTIVLIWYVWFLFIRWYWRTLNCSMGGVRRYRVKTTEPINVFTIAYYIIFRSQPFKKRAHKMRLVSFCVAWSLSWIPVFFFVYAMNSGFYAFANSLNIHTLYGIHNDITLLELLASGWSVNSYAYLLNVDPIEMRNLGMYINNILMPFYNASFRTGFNISDSLCLCLFIFNIICLHTILTTIFFVTFLDRIGGRTLRWVSNWRDFWDSLDREGDIPLTEYTNYDDAHFFWQEFTHFLDFKIYFGSVATKSLDMDIPPLPHFRFPEWEWLSEMTPESNATFFWLCSVIVRLYKFWSYWWFVIFLVLLFIWLNATFYFHCV